MTSTTTATDGAPANSAMPMNRASMPMMIPCRLADVAACLLATSPLD
jgi:hypothetical protein